MLSKPEGNVLMKKAIHDSNIPKYDEKWILYNLSNL